MKNCILTPTYKGHFKFIVNYLKSFDKYVSDGKDMPICFILSTERETSEFDKIIAPYKGRLDIKVYVFDEIVKNFGLEINTEGLLEKYGHTSYQMLKKLYGMLYVPAESFFILDSEAVWIRPTNMNEKFEEFYKAPYIIVSDFSNRIVSSDSLNDHFAATNYILGHEMEKMPFEHFMWFYKKTVVKQIIQKYGQPYEMMLAVHKWEMEEKGHSVGLMETMLCLNYIYENAKELGYRVLQAEEELCKYLGEREALHYINHFFTSSQGEHLGILEFPCDMLLRTNVHNLADLFRNNKIWITRCDMVTRWNKRMIETFLKESGISLLAVGQDHIFLPDISKNTQKTIVRNSSVALIIRKMKQKIKKMTGKR